MRSAVPLIIIYYPIYWLPMRLFKEIMSLNRSADLRCYLPFWMLLLLVACGSSPEKPTDPDLLAQVGEATITADRLDKAVAILYPQAASRPQQVEEKVLQRLIDFELMVIGARARNLENDWQVRNLVEAKKQELQLDELFFRGILKSGPHVSDEEAREYFERHRISEQRRLGRILLDTPPAASRLLARLRAGEEFARMASEFSQEAETAANGGDLGWMSRLSFKSHMLRRQLFDADVGEVVGPIHEPDGYSLLKIIEVRHVSFDSSAAAVKKAMIEQKKTIDTFNFLEDLADRAGLQENAESLQLLLARLSEAGKEMPELKKGEGKLVLFTMEDTPWTLSQFLSAMVSERDQAEIRTIEDLRLYARRLFALKVLLSRRATELGLDETERVKKGVERTLRQALMDRLRQVEVDERIDPSDEDLRSHYEQHRDQFATNERISIQEILVDTRDMAEKLLAEIEQGGDMDELARRYTQRSSRVRRAGGRVQLMRPDKYGSVGWEAKNAKEGDIVGPVKSTQGYSIFKVLDIVPARQLSFEEAKGRANARLRQELTQQKIEDLLERLREQHERQVEIYEDHFYAYLQGKKGG
jgi:parvulin-like peptidyl-prolyl isomerase